MKKYLISIVAILVVLAVAWTVFGQEEGRTARPRSAGREGRGMFQMLSPEEAAQMREKWPNMSEEEREKFRTQMRERWEKMSEEEKEAARARMREGFGGRRGRLSREEQLKAIKVIQDQVANLKKAIEQTDPDAMRRFRELSEQERTELREKLTKSRQEQQQAIKTIITQIAMLQGQRQPTEEGDELIIVNTGDLKAIRELAVKEKAEQTAQRLERIARGRMGFGGRPTTPGSPPTPRTPTRTPRRPRTDAPAREQSER